MLSNQPIFDKFNVVITDDFFVEEICEKYNNLLRQKNYPLMSIQDMIRESIQTFESPDFSYDPIIQTALDGNFAGTESAQPAKTSEQSLADQKRLNIVFRHSDGFLTYFCMLEHYFYRYKMGPNNSTNRKPFASIVATTYSRLQVPMSRLYFNKCNFIGIPQLALSHSSAQRTFADFSCQFSYVELLPSVIIPNPKIKAQ